MPALLRPLPHRNPADVHTAPLCASARRVPPKKRLLVTRKKGKRGERAAPKACGWDPTSAAAARSRSQRPAAPKKPRKSIEKSTLLSAGTQSFIIEQRAEMRGRLVMAAMTGQLQHGAALHAGFAENISGTDAVDFDRLDEGSDDEDV